MLLNNLIMYYEGNYVAKCIYRKIKWYSTYFMNMLNAYKHLLNMVCGTHNVDCISIWLQESEWHVMYTCVVGVRGKWGGWSLSCFAVTFYRNVWNFSTKCILEIQIFSPSSEHSMPLYVCVAIEVCIHVYLYLMHWLW